MRVPKRDESSWRAVDALPIAASSGRPTRSTTSTGLSEVSENEGDKNDEADDDADADADVDDEADAETR